MATQTEIDELNASLASASAVAKAASDEAKTYNSQVSDIDKQLSASGIATGKVGVEMSPTELLAFQLKQLDSKALSPGITPEYIASTKALIQDRAKVAIVAQEKNVVTSAAYKAADAIDIQLEQKQTALAGGNTSASTPAAASAAPGNPTTYTPPPTVTPVTTVATATTPTTSEIIANRTALVANKGEPVTVKTDPNNQDVTIYTYSDGTTARRTGGRNAQIIPDVPVSVAPVSTAAQEALDLSNSKKTAADAMQIEVDNLRAQKNADFAALQAAEASGDKAAIAAADAKFTASSNASMQTAKAQIELSTEARAATNEFNYQQTVKTNQEAANANGGGTVAPTSVNTNSETIAQPVAATGEINTNPPLNNANDPYIATQQTVASNVPTGAFTGNAIKDSESTTISYENGIVTKTQVFGVTASPVNPANDATVPNEDGAAEGGNTAANPQNTDGAAEGGNTAGNFPNAPEIVPNEDGAAEGGNTAGNFPNEPPVVPNDDGAAEGGNTVGNFLNEPPVVPNEDGAAEGGNTAANPQNDDGAAEGGNTVGNFLQEPPVVPNEDGAAEGGNTAADAAALANNGTQDNGDGAAEGGNTVGDIQPVPPPKPPAFPAPKDWRVRISLAPGAKYFYNAERPGILAPLKDTGGVIFPYTPTVSVTYSARYDTQSPTHSNYNIHNYQGSSVDQITIAGDFTAQDVNDANYMLAVIHFFKSATKMFYGQDNLPARGVPPPLLYLSGYGAYQFDNHPMVLTNFAYSLPTDVDYVNAYPNGTANSLTGVPLDPLMPAKLPTPSKGLFATAMDRLLGAGLPPGAKTQTGQVFLNKPSPTSEVTRVPTKINISLTLQPIITRNAISNKFSLEQYANGSLLRGSRNPGTGGGIW